MFTVYKAKLSHLYNDQLNNLNLKLTICCLPLVPPPNVMFTKLPESPVCKTTAIYIICYKPAVICDFVHVFVHIPV